MFTFSSSWHFNNIDLKPKIKVVNDAGYGLRRSMYIDSVTKNKMVHKIDHFFENGNRKLANFGRKGASLNIGCSRIKAATSHRIATFIYVVFRGDLEPEVRGFSGSFLADKNPSDMKYPTKIKLIKTWLQAVCIS